VPHRFSPRDAEKLLRESDLYIRVFCNIVLCRDFTVRSDGHVAMDEQNKTQENARRGFSKKMKLLINGLAVGVAIICFVVNGIWIGPEGPFFDAPLRSFLTGLGLLSLACPLFSVGFIFQKKAAASPYFEDAFIRTGFYIVGFVCFFVGLICIGLSIYALIMRATNEEKPSSILSMSLFISNGIGLPGDYFKSNVVSDIKRMAPGRFQFGNRIGKFAHGALDRMFVPVPAPPGSIQLHFVIAVRQPGNGERFVGNAGPRVDDPAEYDFPAFHRPGVTIAGGDFSRLKCEIGEIYVRNKSRKIEHLISDDTIIYPG
jgi:hypothetical protein